MARAASSYEAFCARLAPDAKVKVNTSTKGWVTLARYVRAMPGDVLELRYVSESWHSYEEKGKLLALPASSVLSIVQLYLEGQR